ncbi:peptide synthetase XpsB domain protein [Pseudomonas putida S610]|nr:peptide synthetase XpsB domain protein [Pseudomonas putida S610]
MVQQSADLLAIDLGHGLHGKCHGIAHIVYVDHQRVVAALHRRHLLDAVPGLAQALLSRCAVAEVKQAGEQCL